MAWLHAVYFLDQNHGWVAGSNGTLVETLDGGATWEKLSVRTTDTLRDVYFADDHVGWLLAERDEFKLKTNDEARSYLLKTEDGGLTWRSLFLEGVDANARLTRAVFVDGSNGWVFGETGVAFFTRDGGLHWTHQSLPTKHLLLGGTFVDAARGCLVGAGGTILKTSDAGTTWHVGVVREGANVRLASASFVTDRIGWAVGSAGHIYATTDGGGTWFAQRSNVDGDLLDVKFINAAEGWAAGASGMLLRTFDGGAHWFVEPSNVSRAIERLSVIDRTHAWAVGFGGTILSYARSDAPRLR